MNIQQLIALRLEWKLNPNKVISKQAALEVLDDYIMYRHSDVREGTLQPFRSQGDTFGLSEDYGA